MLPLCDGIARSGRWRRGESLDSLNSGNGKCKDRSNIININHWVVLGVMPPCILFSFLFLVFPLFSVMILPSKYLQTKSWLSALCESLPAAEIKLTFLRLFQNVICFQISLSKEEEEKNRNRVRRDQVRQKLHFKMEIWGKTFTSKTISHFL